MNDSALAGRGIADLGRLIRKRELSPRELVAAVFQRIRAVDPAVNAFIRLCEEAAVADAEQAEREIAAGDWRGPLHGVPFAVKDIIDAAGIPTTGGSRVWKEFVPGADAPAVGGLKRAGAVLVGKLNLHELAFGITSRNPHFGPVRNPWDLSASCGGSSSGSAAALAAGLVPLTLGTDTGGSIRIPSALCGVAGLKPTYGLVSREGVLPLAWSMDHVGPMARRAQDLAIALDAMTPKGSARAGADADAPANSAPRPERVFEKLVIGIPRAFFDEGLREDIARCVLAAVDHMRLMGARVREIEIPGFAAADRAAFTILFSEAAACLEAHTRRQPEALGAAVMEGVRLGMTIPATRYIQALRVRSRAIAAMERMFADVDLLVAPATMADAHLLEAEEVVVGGGLTVDVRTAMTRYTRFFNLTGHPVLCLPCGFSGRGLPVGMQLAAAPFRERQLLAIGSAYQSAFPLEPAVAGLTQDSARHPSDSHTGGPQPT
ncbi:MAG: amidase [Desulfobacterales bacterium]|jgi:aspartyl-tRNA(Asn)/glutamyl-tRNA(Gln) amidotransferase subunit A|nr:amidase [Desulfobacterales bacterium]